MKFSISAVVLALATVAVAAPGNGYKAPNELEVENKVSNVCGQAQMSCCNKQTTTVNGDEQNGLLGGVLGTVLGKGSDVGLFDGCSKLSLSALVGVTDLLSDNSPCKQQVACCQNNDQNAEGVLAVNLPCIPISGLL